MRGLGAVRRSAAAASAASAGRASAARWRSSARSSSSEAAAAASAVREPPALAGEYVPFYTVRAADAPLARRAELRADPAALAALEARADAVLVALRDGKCLVKHGGDGEAEVAAATVPLREAAAIPGARAGPLLFLGTAAADGAPWFAAEVAAGAPGEAVERRAGPGAEWRRLRDVGDAVEAGAAAVLAYAAGLGAWHSRTRFCAKCGSATEPRRGGHALFCATCGRSQYPRLDPSAIVQVSSGGGDYMLLGRKRAWSPGRYSVVAGFAEVGETVEEACAREVLEETGVALDPASVRYHSSQPWPFPQSLMLAYHTEASALANSPELRAKLRAQDVPEHLVPPNLQAAVANEDELEDARWFHRGWLNEALDGAGREVAPGVRFNAPSNMSVSRRLIDEQRLAHAGEPPGLARLADVVLDAGTQKYVLALVTSPAGEQKLVVRGLAAAGYHNEVFDHFFRPVAAAGYDVRPAGGGRIEHHPEQGYGGVCHVYGFSYAYDQAPHEATARLLTKAFPTLAVSWSDEGY